MSSMLSSSENPNQEAHERGATLKEWVLATGGCTILIVTIAKSLILTASRGWSSPRLWPWLQLFSAAFFGYVLADLGTGIYHWAVDNYGSPETPIIGSQVVGFQGHHLRPWVLGMGHTATIIHRSAFATSLSILPFTIMCRDHVVLGFISALAGCAIFSQQFHAWAHAPAGKLPAVVVALQGAGIILRRGEHSAHHRPPYNCCYCIVSGVWNRFLDKSGFFMALEVAVYEAVGVKPRSWCDEHDG